MPNLDLFFFLAGGGGGDEDWAGAVTSPLGGLGGIDWD